MDDALAIIQLHSHSILVLCQDDYTPEQLQEWVNYNTLERVQFRLKHHRTYVAEHDSNMVGYVRWNPATNELCSIFVDPDHTRQSIATKLMAIACEDATAHGVTDMWLDASLTAVPFYKSFGWQTGERRMHGALPCIRMTLQLRHDSD